MDKDIQINKITIDEFGRPSGLLAVNKPAGISSHDVVDEVRKVMKTRKVGHAGALDNFATGVLLILLGRYTRIADKLINLGKSYRAKIVFGISTDTQDPEGVVTAVKEKVTLKQEELEKLFPEFTGKINQYVSTYSSVKVDGMKLRVIMRDKRFSKEIKETDGVRQIVFTPLVDSVKAFTVNIPRKEIEITRLEIKDSGFIDARQLEFLKEAKSGKFPYFVIEVDCSKGTYIRQLAEDLGLKLGLPAMVTGLQRTKVGSVSLAGCVEIKELPSLLS